MSKVQVIAKLVEAGHEDLAEKLLHVVDAAPSMDPSKLGTEHDDFWALLKTIEQVIKKYPEAANEALFGLDRALEQADKDLRELHKYSGKMMKRLRKALQDQRPIPLQ
jgi:hypothetical protein